MLGMSQIDIRDLGTDSDAFVSIQASEDSVAIGIGIEVDGDLDILVSLADARRIGQALLDAAG